MCIFLREPEMIWIGKATKVLGNGLEHGVAGGQAFGQFRLGSDMSEPSLRNVSVVEGDSTEVFQWLHPKPRVTISASNEQLVPR